MGETTNITWADATWSPWQGCTPVGEGCVHCYMFREKRAFGQDPMRVVRSKERTFNAPLSWHEPKRIFVCSWSDFFHEAADGWREGAWRIMAMRPRHTYIIPTKRIERAAPFLPWGQGEPWSNVWLLVSASTQPEVDEVVPKLLAVNAAVRGVSLEPFLGAVDVTPYIGGRSFRCRCGYHRTEAELVFLGGDNYKCAVCDEWCEIGPTLDWVIVAGESGGPPERALVEKCAGLKDDNLPHPCSGWKPKPKALVWVRSLRDQCQAANVPFFLKGFGGPRSTSGGDLLDGRQWHQLPECRH